MLSIAACFRPWIKHNCKVLQCNFSFIPDLCQLLQSIFMLEYNVSPKVSWGLHAMFYEWKEWYPRSMKFHEVWMQCFMNGQTNIDLLWSFMKSTFHDHARLINRQSDIQLYIMGPFSWLKLINLIFRKGSHFLYFKLSKVW